MAFSSLNLTRRGGLANLLNLLIDFLLAIYALPLSMEGLLTTAAPNWGWCHGWQRPGPAGPDWCREAARPVRILLYLTFVAGFILG